MFPRPSAGQNLLTDHRCPFLRPYDNNRNTRMAICQGPNYYFYSWASRIRTYIAWSKVRRLAVGRSPINSDFYLAGILCQPSQSDLTQHTGNMSFPSRCHYLCKEDILLPLSSSSTDRTNPNTTMLFYKVVTFSVTCFTHCSPFAAQLGFEPRLEGPEPSVLPIGRPGNKMFLSIVLLFSLCRFTV